MNKVEEIKRKVARLEKRKLELDQREVILDSLLPLGSKLAARIKSKVESNKISLFTETIAGVISKIDDLDNTSEIVEAIEKQTKGLKDKSTQQIVKEIKNLLRVVAKLEKKTFFDQNAFSEAFNASVKKIINAIDIPEEIPELVSYTRRPSDNKITKVIERFSKHRLEHSWSYDGKGNLLKVSTRSIDETD